MATTFKQLDALERQVLEAYIEDELITLSDRIRQATPLNERIRKMNAYYARSRRSGGHYRAEPVKVQPLSKAPYEIKNIPKGERGYERQQAEYERQWLEQRRHVDI